MREEEGWARVGAGFFLYLPSFSLSPEEELGMASSAHALWCAGPSTDDLLPFLAGVPSEGSLDAGMGPEMGPSTFGDVGFRSADSIHGRADRSLCAAAPASASAITPPP